MDEEEDKGWSIGNIMSMLFFGGLAATGVGVAGNQGWLGKDFQLIIGGLLQSFGQTELGQMLGLENIGAEMIAENLRGRTPEEAVSLLTNTTFGPGLSEATAQAVAENWTGFLAAIEAAGVSLASLPQGGVEALMSPAVIQAIAASADISDAARTALFQEVLVGQGVPAETAARLATRPDLIANLLQRDGDIVAALSNIGAAVAANDYGAIMEAIGEDHAALREVIQSIDITDLQLLMGASGEQMELVISLLRTGDNLSLLGQTIDALNEAGVLDADLIGAAVEDLVAGNGLSPETQAYIATIASENIALLAPLAQLDVSALPEDQRAMAQATLGNLGHIITYQQEAQLPAEQIESLFALANGEVTIASIGGLTAIAQHNPEAWRVLVSNVDLSAYPLPLEEPVVKGMLTALAPTAQEQATAVVEETQPDVSEGVEAEEIGVQPHVVAPEVEAGAAVRPD